MREYRLCEICEHQNNVAHLECEACGADISYVNPTTSAAGSSGDASPPVSPVIPAINNDPSRATSVMTAIKLVSKRDGFEIRIPPAGCILGREGEIAREYFEHNSTFVSRSHLQVIGRSGVYYIIDQNTVNGTQINKQPVCGMEERRLDVGDTLTMADLEFVVARD